MILWVYDGLPRLWRLAATGSIAMAAAILFGGPALYHGARWSLRYGKPRACLALAVLRVGFHIYDPACVIDIRGPRHAAFYVIELDPDALMAAARRMDRQGGASLHEATMRDMLNRLYAMRDRKVVHQERSSSDPG